MDLFILLCTTVFSSVCNITKQVRLGFLSTDDINLYRSVFIEYIMSSPVSTFMYRLRMLYESMLVSVESSNIFGILESATKYSTQKFLSQLLISF